MGHCWYISTKRNKADVPLPLFVVLLQSHLIMVIFRAHSEQILENCQRHLTPYTLSSMYSCFHSKIVVPYNPYWYMLMDCQQHFH